MVSGDAYEEVTTIFQFTGKIYKRDNGKFGVYEPGEYFLPKQKAKKGVLSSAWPIKWRFYSDPNFDQAQAALRQEFGDDVQLCQVEIRTDDKK